MQINTTICILLNELTKWALPQCCHWSKCALAKFVKFVFVILVLDLMSVFTLVLEVLQFGRDANVAESWLAGQEPLVRAAELGVNVDEVESLIKRHEAFEKLAAAWEERFVQLEKLTTVSKMFLLREQGSYSVWKFLQKLGVQPFQLFSVH